MRYESLGSFSFSPILTLTSPRPPFAVTRVARYVVPDVPQRVTRRGSRGERVFFSDDDYPLNRDLLREGIRRQARL